MSLEFLNAIDAKPRYATEVKRLHLPRQLRKGGRVNFIWALGAEVAQIAKSLVLF